MTRALPRGGAAFPAVAAALLLVLAPATAPGAAAPLRWDDLVALAEAHPALAAGRRAARAAELGVDVALAAPNPTLGAGVGQGIARFGDETRLEWGLSLTIPLDWLYRRGDGRDVALAEVAGAQAAAAALRLEVLDRLRELFWRLVDAQATAVDLAALEGEVEALVSAVRSRVDLGAARPVEQVRAEAELETLRIDLARVRASERTAAAELAAWLGLETGEDLRVTADFAAAPALPDRAALVRVARTRHPSIATATAAVRASDAALAEERGRRAPTLEVSPFFERELDRDAWGVEVGVELPLWNWNGAGIARAEEERAAAVDRLAAATRTTEAWVVEAHGRCASRRATAARYAAQVLPLLRAAAASQEESYRIGEADLLEALDARRSLHHAHREWRVALLDAWLECSRLTLLTEEFGDGSGERP